MKEHPEVIKLKAFIASEYIDQKISDLVNKASYDNLSNHDKGMLLMLLRKKSKVPIRARA